MEETMKHVTGIDCPRKGYVLIHYWEDEDPEWIDGRKISIYLRANPTVKRLVNVTSRIFELLADHPETLPVNDEILQEWLLQVWEEEGRSESKGISGASSGKG